MTLCDLCDVPIDESLSTYTVKVSQDQLEIPDADVYLALANFNSVLPPPFTSNDKINLENQVIHTISFQFQRDGNVQNDLVGVRKLLRHSLCLRWDLTMAVYLSSIGLK